MNFYNKSTAVHFLHDRPILGFVAALVMALVGTGAGDTVGDSLTSVANTEYHIPPVIMEVFQLFAWTGAGVAGIVAGHGLYLKVSAKFKERKKKKQK